VTCNIPIRPNLELKSGPKQHLGTLPLGIVLPANMLCSFFMHSCVYSKEYELRSSKNILCEYETLLWLFSNAEDVFIRPKLAFFSYIDECIKRGQSKHAGSTISNGRVPKSCLALILSLPFETSFLIKSNSHCQTLQHCYIVRQFMQCWQIWD